MSTFPSILTTYVDPQATDKLNAPSHSGIEQAQNSGLEQVEAVIGTLSSVAGTLMYDIRAAASNGGGHIQTANKGGTGQTSFSKGDILVASSSSVLSKLMVGTDGFAVVADSTQATGLGYQGVPTAATIQNNTYNYAQDSGTGSVFAISPVACVLSYTAGQVFEMKAANSNTVTTPALSVSSLLAKTIKHPDGTALAVGEIVSSSLGLYGYDGTSFQALTPPAMIVKTGGATYPSANNSSVQSIAHGLGKTPKLAEIMGMTDATGTTNVWGLAVTSYDGATNAAIANNETVNSSPTSGQSGQLFAFGTSSNNQTGILSFNSTNLILTWTKTGSGVSAAGNQIILIWKAFA